MVVVAGVTVEFPDNTLAPPHPPDAMHDDVLLEFHVSVDVAPIKIVGGNAENVSIGCAAGTTVTVVVPEIVPPAPVHVIP